MKVKEKNESEENGKEVKETNALQDSSQESVVMFKKRKNVSSVFEMLSDSASEPSSQASLTIPPPPIQYQKKRHSEDMSDSLLENGKKVRKISLEDPTSLKEEEQVQVGGGDDDGEGEVG